MMTRLPRVTGKDVVRALKKLGFIVVRTKGSHIILKHKDGRSTVVPVHTGEIIGPGLLKRILRDCELTVHELVKVL